MENNDTLQNEDLEQGDTRETTEMLSENTEMTETANEVEDLKSQIAELKDKYLRQAAEFDNYRRRMMREKAETIQQAGRDILSAMLPILDDFDRASKNEQFTEGVNLVHQKLISTLAARGLKTMETPPGTPFDTDKHEAITEIPAGDALVGNVVDTVESGFLLNDKIIRYAKVVVGK